MPLQNLYFIAIIPPEDISGEVTAFKKDIAAQYNSIKALKVMPHITLKVPFYLDTDDHSLFMDWFRSLQFEISPFEIELKDFGSFDNSKNPVIYVHPVINDALLSLQKQLLSQFAVAFPNLKISFLEQNFSPHMTIAYRDLEYSQYEKAWEVYKHKRYNARFEVTGFFLLQHDSRQWNIIAEHLL
jgi:2'-5' RNA ligase